MASLFSGRGGALGSLWGDNTIPQGGVMGEPDRTPMQDARLAFAAQLLAGSGGTQGNFAEIMGKALLASRQARLQTQEFQAQRAAQEQENALRQAQIEKMNTVDPTVVPYGAKLVDSAGNVLLSNDRMAGDTGNASDKQWFVASYLQQHPTASLEDAAAAYQRYFNPMQPGVTVAGDVPYAYTRTPQGIQSQGPLVSRAETATNAATVAGSKTSATTTAEAAAKRDFTMIDFDDVVKAAEAELNKKGAQKPTGSGVGTAVDAAAALVGITPPGAEAADSLRSIAATLIGKMPRMEGPQSDRDSNLYAKAAGDIGNSQLPIDRRKAALRTVKQLHQKYAGSSALRPTPDEGAVIDFKDLP